MDSMFQDWLYWILFPLVAILSTHMFKIAWEFAKSKKVTTDKFIMVLEAFLMGTLIIMVLHNFVLVELTHEQPVEKEWPYLLLLTTVVFIVSVGIWKESKKA